MIYTCSMFLFGKKSAVAIAKKLGHLGRVSTGHHLPGVGLFTRIVVETEMAKMVVQQHFKSNKIQWHELEKIEDLDNLITEKER